MSFLVDTDLCSAYMKGNQAVWNRFLQYSGRLHVSAVTAGELFTWALRAKASPARLQSLHDLMRDLIFLPVDHAIARQFGEIRAQLFDRGIVIPEMDLLIAATALEHGLTMATHNVQDFANVPGLQVIDCLVP